MINNQGPPGTAQSSGEGDNPNRLATQEEERAFVSRLVDLRSDIVAAEPTIREHYEHTVTDESGSEIGLSFSTEFVEEIDSSLQGINVWYSTDLVPITESPKTFQARVMSAFVSTEVGHDIGDDGFFMVTDKVSLYDSRGERMPTEREIAFRKEVDKIRADYPEDHPVYMGMVADAAIRALPKERMQGETGQATLEQINMLHHFVDLLEADLGLAQAN